MAIKEGFLRMDEEDIVAKSSTGTDRSIAPAARPESLTRFVHDAIRKAIVDKTLEPGARVTEAGLAEQLNVSKTPVREVLLELRQAGLIEDWGRRGGRIISPSRQAITEVIECREAIEVYLAGAVAERASPEACGQIVDLARRSRFAAEKSDGIGFHEVNLSFHLAFADAIGNSLLRRNIDNVLTLGAVLRLRDFPKQSPLMQFAEDHMAIAEAVLNGDRAAAEEAARAHVRHSADYNLAAFAESEQRSEGHLATAHANV